MVTSLFAAADHQRSNTFFESNYWVLKFVPRPRRPSPAPTIRSTQTMQLDTTTAKCFFGYWALIGTVFTFLSGPDVATDIMKVNEDSTALVGNHYAGTFGTLDDLTMEVTIVYCQVVGAMSLMPVAIMYFEGSKWQWFFAELPIPLIMLRHILLDGLIPPIPPMVLTAIVMTTSTLHATGMAPVTADQAKYVFVGQCVLNLLAFVADPKQVVLDTFPSASGASLEAGVLMVGVIQFSMATCIVMALMEGAKARFATMCLVLGQWYRDIIVQDSGPPLPVIVGGLGLSVATAYEFFATGDSAKGKKA